MLDNREWALLIWLVAGFGFALIHQKLRSALWGVAHALVHPRVFTPLLAMAGYVCVLVLSGSLVGLWRPDLGAATVVWFAGPAFGLMLNLERAVRVHHFFARRALGVVKWSILVESYVSLAVLSLAAELVLLPTLVFLAMLSVAAGSKEAFRSVKTLVDGVISLAGVGLLIFVTARFVQDWGSVNNLRSLRVLALPVWLTVGVMPFLYTLSLYGGYEMAFLRIKLAAEGTKARWRAKVALVSRLHLRTRELAAFAGFWPERVASAASLAEARAVVAEFLTSRRAAERAPAERRERLRRYAGMTGVDADGRQLDQREFEETKDGLRRLATAEGGWYRHPGSRYRSELLEPIAPQLERAGLPADHGITLLVARDGQSWWAWRRTITGWCFAIGAAGPPPDEWLFDGPEPPGGYPGQDQRWGGRWGVDTRNW